MAIHECIVGLRVISPHIAGTPMLAATVVVMIAVETEKAHIVLNDANELQDRLTSSKRFRFHLASFL